MGTANLSAANSEANNVKTGAKSFMMDNGAFPADSSELYGGTVNYMSEVPDGSYTFDAESGQITVAIAGTGITDGLNWDAEAQMWKK